MSIDKHPIEAIPAHTPLLPDRDAGGFDLREFLFAYVLRYWYLYVGFLGAAFFFAWVKIRYETPIYRLRSTLLIKTERSGSEGISQEAIIKELGIMQGGPVLENEMQILQSRALMTEVARTLGLDVEYYTKGRVRTSESYPGWPIKAASYQVTDAGYNVPFEFTVLDTARFRLKVGSVVSERQFGERLLLPQGSFVFTLLGPANPETPYQVVFRRPEDLGARFSGALSIRPVNNYASVLELSITHPVPAKGMAILNTLVEEYNKATIEDKNAIGRNTVQFIDDRLKYLTTELSSVESDLEQYKRANEIPTEISSSVDQIVTQLSENDRELSQLEIQRALLQSLQEYLTNNLTRFESAPINLIPDNERVSALVTEYNQLVLERQRLLRTATTDNPVVQNLTTQVEQLRASILETIGNSRAALELGLAGVRAKNSMFQNRIRSFPTKERGLIEIKRQQGIKEALFLYLLQKREETALTLAVAVPNSRVIDSAIGAGQISPNSRSIYITYLFISLLLAAGIVYVRHQLVDTIQSEGEISAKSRIPLLGHIAQKTGDEQIVVNKNSRTAMAEMFRLLRTNLQFIGAGNTNQVILLTSSISGEGKSFITLNLAITLALAEKKTLVIELDLRKPKVIKYLTKSPAAQGITNYLIGQSAPAPLVQQSAVHPNLYYLASGPIPPNPAELLLSDALGNLLAQLRQEFDYILLDTPPIGMVADALLLGAHADSSLYIVRHGYTPKIHLRLLEDLYRDAKLPRMAVVFNGVKKDQLFGYGYGSKYGYGYGYRYGYGHKAGYKSGYYQEDGDGKKKAWWKRMLRK